MAYNSRFTVIIVTNIDPLFGETFARKTFAIFAEVDLEG